jgi:exonuclease III/ribonuclease HI
MESAVTHTDQQRDTDNTVIDNTKLKASTIEEIDDSRSRETTPITSFLKQQRDYFVTQQRVRNQSIDFPPKVTSRDHEVNYLETYTDLIDNRTSSETDSESENITNNPQLALENPNTVCVADSTISAHNDGETIHIGTHNVRGINKTVEQDNLITEMNERRIDILGVSETKLHDKDTFFAFRDHPKYKCFTSSTTTNTFGNGVALLVEKNLAKHVSKVDRIEGRIIATHIYLKRCKLYIMQIYLPSNKKDSMQYQRAIRQLITKEMHAKSKIIVMGDFNAASNPLIDRHYNSKLSNTWRPEAEIFNFLNDWAFTDVQLTWEMGMPSPTWIGRASFSRIDYIWVSPDIATNNIHSVTNEKADNITNSDHTLLCLKLFAKGITETTKVPPIRQKSSRIVIKQKAATKVQWEKFTKKVEERIGDVKLKSRELVRWYTDKAIGNSLSSRFEQIEALKELDEIWEKFAAHITKAAHEALPTKKIKNSGKEKETPPSTEFYQYRRSLRIKKILDEAEHTRESKDIHELSKIIQDFNKTSGVTWPITDYSQSLKSEEIDWQKWRREVKEAIGAFKEVCINMENRRKQKDIKKMIEQRCLDYKDSQKRMVRSLTNNHQTRINIDRIMVTEECEVGANSKRGNTESRIKRKYISTQPKVIEQQVESYYIKAFKKRNSNFDSLSQGWKDQYEPRTYIEEEWFDNTLKEIELWEVNETIKNLPTNKAPGPTGITYEMLKKLGNEGKQTLTNIFNAYIMLESIPTSWKHSNIYPIPKKEDWMADLANTRPIVLMEATRKCFTKIINNRLSLTCKEKNVLRGPNFAGLPGESTQEPIQLLNNICEEAREQNKELWILLQDTAKAFDTVNLEMLSKALARVKIPRRLINIILSLFNERKFQVITEYGLTKTVTAGDGIDQGETMSPILWRIFYDPLLCKIQDNKELGYTMQCRWHPNMETEVEDSLELRSAAIAYMDDTTWIANSKQSLQKTLDEAREFYKANDSQINSRKSVLITINSSESQEENNHVHAGLDGGKVERIKPDEYTRFLGVWIGSKNQKKDTIHRIQEEVNKIKVPLERKKITDKQALYILNRVLIPRIEYRMQTCHLSEKECELLTSKYRGILKKKAEICGTLPSSAVHQKDIYNLKNIWDLQIESQISGLINRLNDRGTAGKSTLIRLKQAQVKSWEPANILTEEIGSDFGGKGNFSATLIKVANKMGIRFENTEMESIFQWSGGSTDIRKTLDNRILYKKALAQLRERKLMYVDQIIDSKNGSLLSWQTIKGMGAGSNKGRTPKWYEVLKAKIIGGDDKLKDGWREINWERTDESSSKLYDTPSEDKRIKEWCCFRDERNGIQWGKIKEKTGKESENKWQLYHYRCIPDGQQSILEECSKDCGMYNKQNEHETQLTCIVTVEKKNIFACRLLNKKGNNHRKDRIEVPCKAITLEEFVPKEKQEGNNERVSEVLIEDWDEEIIKSLIRSEEYRDGLIKRLWENKRGQSQENMVLQGTSWEYEYYTDGSLIDRGIEEEAKETRMGAAWIQTKGPMLLSSFKCGIQDWPSSCRAEAVAILIALLATPGDNKVTIVTDSRSCIETFRSLSKIDPKRTHRKWLKIKNWSVWNNIMEVVKKKNIKLSLKKVKAHSGEEYNERADQLAKEANQLPAIEWNFKGGKYVQTAMKWKGTIVEKAPREFIKQVTAMDNTYRWTRQKRNQRLLGKQVNRSEEYTWKQFWSHMRISGLHTSFKESKKRNFRIKMLHNEMPTLEKLTERKPHLYSDANNRCRMCNLELETRDHLFECSSMEHLNKQAWEKTTAKVITMLEKIEEEKREINCNKKVDKFQQEMFIDGLTRRMFGEKTNRMKFALGIVKKQHVIDLGRIFGGRCSKTKMGLIMSKASAKYLESFRKIVWRKRCEETVEIDKLLGIDLRTKKRKAKKAVKKGKRKVEIKDQIDAQRQDDGQSKVQDSSQDISQDGSQDDIQGDIQGDSQEGEKVGRGDKEKRTEGKRLEEEMKEVTVVGKIWKYIKNGVKWLGVI